MEKKQNSNDTLDGGAGVQSGAGSVCFHLIQYAELNIFVLDLLVTEKEKIFVVLPNHFTLLTLQML